MPRRQPKRRKPVPSVKPPGPAATLRQALARRKKAELVDALVELAEGDRAILRQLTARFDVAMKLEELVAATHQRSRTQPTSTSARSTAISTMTTKRTPR
jgi:hypothetical protein